MKPIFKFKINLLRDIVYKNSNIEKQHTIRINNLIPSIKIAKKKMVEYQYITVNL